MEIKHLTGCLEKAFKIGCFRFHNLATFEDQDVDLHPLILRGSKIMEYKAPHEDASVSFVRCCFSILCEVLLLNRSLTLMIVDLLADLVLTEDL
jgi:hypothetical protein